MTKPTPAKAASTTAREVVLEVDTAMGLRVVCYGDTVDDHLATDRKKPTMISSTKAALDASEVYSGTTNPGYLAFVNQNDTSPGGNSPFVVFVDPQSAPAAVASVGYRRDFKDVGKHTKVWPPAKTPK